LVWSGGRSSCGGGDYYQCAVGSMQNARDEQKTVRLGDWEGIKIMIKKGKERGGWRNNCY